MPQQEENLDADFDSQLRGLFQEATQSIEDRDAAARRVEEEKEQEISSAARGGAVARVLRQAADGSYSASLWSRVWSGDPQAGIGENTTVLQKLDRVSEQAVAANESLPGLIDGLKTLVEQKNGLNERMFDALHEELKGYKDGFLLESVHKPIIRDLISLYDDLTTIHRQMQEAVLDAAKLPSSVANKLLERLKTMDTNIEHNIEFIIEVLARLEVTMMPTGPGKLDKQSQRAVAVEIAEDPDDDGNVVRVAKRGFCWKGRPLRPEEVIIKKWKEGFLVALANPLDQK